MEHFYSCEQVAERYGVKVATVWEWIRSKKLPAIKIGKQYVQGLLRALGFEVFSAVDSTEKIEAVLARCREVLRDEGFLSA